MIQFTDHEPEDNFPDLVQFHDPEVSWEMFKYLEAFKDGFGAWRFLPGPGLTVVEQDEALMEDLMTWRWLADIARRQNEKNKPDGS